MRGCHWRQGAHRARLTHALICPPSGDVKGDVCDRFKSSPAEVLGIRPSKYTRDGFEGIRKYTDFPSKGHGRLVTSKLAVFAGEGETGERLRRRAGEARTDRQSYIGADRSRKTLGGLTPKDFGRAGSEGLRWIERVAVPVRGAGEFRVSVNGESGLPC